MLLQKISACSKLFDRSVSLRVCVGHPPGREFEVEEYDPFRAM